MEKETEWRRHWKSTLLSSPWHNLTVSGKHYLVKCHMTAASYQILITDYVTMWSEDVDETIVQKRCKRLNPNVEAPLQKILDNLVKNLEDQQKGTKFHIDMKNDSSTLVLSVDFNLVGHQFKWKFLAEEAEKETLSQHLTMPMLAMITELQRREVELFMLLKAKDKQIEDYKMQGAKSTRKHLDTAVFDSVSFTNAMSTSQGFTKAMLNKGVVDDTTRHLYTEVITKQAYIQHQQEQGVDVLKTMSPTKGAGGAPSTGGTSWGDRVPTSIVSPTKSPASSPEKKETPVKDTELMRRQALERKLQQEEIRKEKPKKKKKIAF